MSPISYILFILLLLNSAASASVIVLNDSAKNQVVHESIKILEDKDGTYSLADVTTGHLAQEFSTPGGNYFSLGFTDSVYWYRFSVTNPYVKNKKRLLLLTTPWVDQVIFYSEYSKDRYQSVATGANKRFKERELEHHQFIFRLDIPPGTSSYLMRMNTPKPFMTPLFLMEPTTFHHNDWMNAAYYGAVFGSILIMFFYNGIIYASIRDHRYLFYCLYLSSFFIMFFSYNGFSYQFLWPESPGWTYWADSLTIYLFQITGIIFAISFLGSKTRMPKLHSFLKIYIVILLITPLVTYLSSNALLFNKLAIYSIFLYSPLIAFAGLLALFSGFHAARFFVIASLASLTGAFFSALTVSGFLSYSFISYHAVELGLLVDLVLLSLAMADRINLMNNERNIEQKRAMGIELNANRQLIEAKAGLEKTIEIRTKELTIAKENAENLARVDALTGVSNRRAFQEASALEFKRTRRNSSNLSIALFDLDKFKNINDRYGHSTGDTIIRHATNLAQSEIRDIDILSRVGGEEFAILFPETSLAEAQDVAARIQKKMMDAEVETHGNTIRYTASFGVAQLESDHESLEVVLHNADTAMYISKRNGRNCVTRWTKDLVSSI